MTKLLLITIGIFSLCWLIIKSFTNRKQSDEYNKNVGNYDKGSVNQHEAGQKSKIEEAVIRPKKAGIFRKIFGYIDSVDDSTFFAPYFPFDKESTTWCANFLGIETSDLKIILRDIPNNYSQFKMAKRSGGFRIISAPQAKLLSIQRTIYRKILLPVNIHPAATGFRHGVSIADNAKVHLSKKNILKTDIKDFFGSVKEHAVIKAFERIGYPEDIAKIFAYLCCLKKQLPQGAPTSPALSNIIAYDMDKKLATLSTEYGLKYSRYADDLTFSGDSISQEQVLPKITEIIRQDKFILNRKKTALITEKRRKIITGISISSGNKLTIPKSKKREMRKTVYFIRTKGLEEHQKHIGSTDPAYLKRTLGYLSFWLSVEPDNAYVIDSITALKQLDKKRHSSN